MEERPKVLVTAFDPFGGESINPAQVAVMLLPDEIDGITVIKRVLPVVFGRSAEILCEIIEEERPVAVISVGQAGGRPSITVERVAINIDDARIPDNDGVKREDTPIAIDGPAAYFSTLPIKAIVSDLKESGIPAAISDSAGTFVCNHIMYSALHWAALNQLELKAGFVHIPYLPEQTVDKPNMPSMSAENIIAGLVIIIKTVL
ncbi:MAG: pyroglutamyl-peptidase I [Defluviitaleaceae bacterium]|nr:pyroglutamyl-peptidase I [Defluviitaleaceae bacterium]